MGHGNHEGHVVGVHEVCVGVEVFGRCHSNCSSICRKVGIVDILVGYSMGVLGAFWDHNPHHNDLLLHPLLALPLQIGSHQEVEGGGNLDKNCNRMSCLTCLVRRGTPLRALNLQPRC